MKWILIIPAVFIHILMRWCEIGAKVFGILNDKCVDLLSAPTKTDKQ